MINEEKIKLMNKMAMYEEKQGQEDFKISSYHKKDYTSFQTILTLSWVTIGYALIIGVLAVVFLDMILENLGLLMLAVIAAAILIVYIVLLISYGLFASRFYQKKHTRARGRVKKYTRMLTQLERYYGQERKKKYE